MIPIVLIRGPVVLSAGRIGSVTASPPLGIASIAAYLEKHGMHAGLIDAYGEDPLRRTDAENCHIYGLTNDEILQRIPPKARIVGFSCMFSNEWFYLRRLISAVKQRFPEVITVLGGEHATALPGYCLESCAELDYVVRGEGERVFRELAEALLHGAGDPGAISGITVRGANGEPVHHPRSGRIRNLDELPWPDWRLVPVENYLKNGIAVISAAGNRTMPVLASRGCPYACKFCSNAEMWGAPFLMRNAEDVVREIRFYRDAYRINSFELHDLTFIMQKRWVLEFTGRLIEEGLDLTWNVQATRSETIDEEIADALYRSGCRNLTLTPDSGSERQLRDMNKRVDLDTITEKVRLLLRKQIILKVNLVIGFPDERHRDVWKSILYGMKLSVLGASSVLFYRFVPYPGSAYFELLRTRKQLPDFNDDFDRFLITNVFNELSDIRSYSSHVSGPMLRFYLFFGYGISQFCYLFFHPLQVVGIIRRIVLGRPQSQIEILILNTLRRMGGRRPAPPRVNSKP